MKILEAMILGLIQGLGEFLPISSSGHLILVREMMGITGDYLMFDICLHLATLLAVCIVFFKELLSLFKKPFKPLLLLILATIPAVITGVIYSVSDIDIFESAKYLCFFFLLSAILMLLSEYFGKKFALKAENNLISGATGVESITLKNALCMGLMQSAAIVPGLTRSGSTIFGGLVSGGERKSVAKFSFFMSAPIILGAAVFQMIKGGGEAAVSIAWYSYALGMAVAFASGFFSIKFMMKIIGKANFKWFSLYLFILSIVTFFIYFL